MEMGTLTQMLTAGSYPVLHPQTPQTMQSQEMPRETLVLASNLIRQTNCLTLLRMRLMKLKPLQELVLDVIHPELTILLIITVSKLLGNLIVSPFLYLSCVPYDLVWGSVVWLIINAYLSCQFPYVYFLLLCHLMLWRAPPMLCIVIVLFMRTYCSFCPYILYDIVHFNEMK